MAHRPETRDSDSAQHPRYWANAFHEQEPALGGTREIFEIPSPEFARDVPSTPLDSITGGALPPTCPGATPVSTMPMPKQIPTTLSNQSSASNTHQVALVAATTGGAIVLVFIVFAAIFFRMRCKQRQQDLTDTLAREERNGKGAGAMGMLDGEGFRDSVRGGGPPQFEFRRPQIEYHVRLSSDLERGAQPPDSPPTPRYTTLPPFLFPSRASDSGSAFREEVWPPPREESVFIDPLLHAPAGDLSRIITDIMGHPNPNAHSSSLPTFFPLSLSGAASPRSRRNSCSTIYAPTILRSTASSPTLPLSTLSADAYSGSEDDPSWPPTPGVLPGTGNSGAPPVSYWQRAGAPALAKSAAAPGPTVLVPRPHPPLGVPRPWTGDGSRRVKNWLERTPRRIDPDGPVVARRAASEGH
ncbi:hypothetical protein C8R44DRAFT_861706 [Mycena epipterygia]|nr:hypothetical protein C8R44DRAFT_861706 [Mycena epipterygia]